MRSRPRIFETVRRFFRRENGTHMVELAIALPVMLMLLGGLAEFGRFFYTYSKLTTAVRAGARHACKWERNASWTFPETSNIVVYGDFGGSGSPIVPGLSTANVTVTANGPSVNNVDSVTVRIVNYRYTPLFDVGKLVGIPALSLNVYMNANATMHQLYNGPTAGS
ncbi:MAG TPA: TadE/TadG family type IV pilus assembly protein [Pyrinomonadaceae bacterium]|nr:TadE/TadG family type IV pilus assembly protein [Pyrinomonadaceae bacterium]